MTNSALNTQVGGDHYKNLTMQPIEFAVKARLSYIQGCIVKYVSRYKNKNGKQDLEKIIHFANLALELNENTDNLISGIGLAYTFCKANRFSKTQTNIIVCVVKDDYTNVIRYCNQLIKLEYPLT